MTAGRALHQAEGPGDEPSSDVPTRQVRQRPRPPWPLFLRIDAYADRQYADHGDVLMRSLSHTLSVTEGIRLQPFHLLEEA